MPGILEQLDAQLEHFFAGWNLWSTLLTLLTLIAFLYPLFSSHEPDTHPLLLSRQANVAAVRQPGESAVYRALEVPHGYPLKSGLNVKAKGASKWSAGRDGDIRDIWRLVVNGPQSPEGESTGPPGKILTVFGKEDIENHDLRFLSRQVNILGQYFKQQGCSCVTVYLPNSIELLLTVFACAFYGLHPVLVPYDQPQKVALSLLKVANADFLIASAGSLPLSDVKQQCPGIHNLVWVVEKTSRHMDWSEPSQGASAWHEIVEGQAKGVSDELPEGSSSEIVPDLISIWQNDTPGSGEVVAFSQQNIVSAVAAQMSALPHRHRMSPSDLFLPADSLTNPYILVQTLAALYSNASLALNSVAGKDVDLPLAAMGISPTIIAVSAESALKLHQTTRETITGSAKQFALSAQSSALDSGYMPPATLLSRINTPTRATLGNVPSKLRLMYVFERANAGTPPLSATELSDLRAFTGARVIYALTAAKVAGPVAQTNFYDYRRLGQEKGKHSHFGVPVSALEAKVVDAKDQKTVEGKQPKGEIVVSGPAVRNGSASLSVMGTFREDGTLAYL